MNTSSTKEACTRRCWWTGAAVGVIVAILSLIGGWGWLGAILVGLILWAVVGFGLSKVLCSGTEDENPFGSSAEERRAAARQRDSGADIASASLAGGAGATVASPDPQPKVEPNESGTTSAVEFVDETPDRAEPAASAEELDQAAPVESPPAKSDAAAPAEKPVNGVVPDADDVKAESDAPFKVRPSKPLQGQAELAARKGSWKYDPAAGGADAAAPVADSTAEVSEEMPSDADGEGKAPVTLDAPRGGSADDLQRIGGVGPKMEQTLNDLGFYHYDQIANWTEEEIDWVDSRLRFKGRIRRDDWVGQASALAKATQG